MLARLEKSRRGHEDDSDSSSSSSSSESESDSDQAQKRGHKKKRSHKTIKVGKKKSKKGKRLRKGDEARPDQIAFYKGHTRTILEKVKSTLRIHLATVNPFSTVEQVLRVVRKAFPKARDEVLDHVDGGDVFMSFRLSDHY